MDVLKWKGVSETEILECIYKVRGCIILSSKSSEYKWHLDMRGRPGAFVQMICWGQNILRYQCKDFLPRSVYAVTVPLTDLWPGSMSLLIPPCGGHAQGITLACAVVLAADIPPDSTLEIIEPSFR